MEQFMFYQDEKITCWERNTFLVKAESYEKALEFIKSLEGEDLRSHEEDGILEFLDCETLYETAEYMSLNENNGQVTLEVLDSNYDVIYNNEQKHEDN